MKRYVLVAIIIALIVSFTGCVNAWEYNDPDQYLESLTKSISYHVGWTKPTENVSGVEVRLDDTLPETIPHKTEDSTVLKYYNRFEELLPVGETVETFLSIQYEVPAFGKEISRISQLAFELPIIYDTSHFAYPAYVTVLGEDN